MPSMRQRRMHSGRSMEIADWIKPFTKVKNTCFRSGQGRDAHGFEDGITNVSANCIRWASGRARRSNGECVEGDDPGESRKITYRHDQVCRLANVLKNHGVKKGDTVTRSILHGPGTALAMLACAGIWAVTQSYSVGSGGDLDRRAHRRLESKVVRYGRWGWRGGREDALNADVRKPAAVGENSMMWSRTTRRASTGVGRHVRKAATSGGRLEVSTPPPKCDARRRQRGSAVHPCIRPARPAIPRESFSTYAGGLHVGVITSIRISGVSDLKDAIYLLVHR